MSWTAPRSWVVGEVVTAAEMNAHVRDNMKALGDLSAASRLNPYAGLSGGIIGAAANVVGDANNYWIGPMAIQNTTGLYGSNGVIDWASFTAVSSTVQWRAQIGWNMTVIIAGSPSAQVLVARYQNLGNFGFGGTGAITDLDTPASFTNATGVKAHDSGWLTAPTGDTNGHYALIAKWSKTGGTTAGSLDRCFYVLQIRNQ